jgi:drug/metabolite transporter (DMT)-like permease
MSLVVLLISVAFAVAAQLTLKTAMNDARNDAGGIEAGIGRVLKASVKQPELWVGLFLFGVSAVFWLVVLSRVRLSAAYPMLGVSYVVLVLFARVILHEHVPGLRWFGAIVVSVGVALIGLGDAGRANRGPATDEKSRPSPEQREGML